MDSVAVAAGGSRSPPGYHHPIFWRTPVRSSPERRRSCRGCRRTGNSRSFVTHKLGPTAAGQKWASCDGPFGRVGNWPWLRTHAMPMSRKAGATAAQAASSPSTRWPVPAPRQSWNRAVQRHSLARATDIQTFVPILVGTVPECSLSSYVF